MKKAIIVLGTGRSGTSAMAGCLNILGAHVGNEPKPGNHANAKGYFEETKIVALNKYILKQYLNIEWYGDVSAFKQPAEFSAEIIALIKFTLHLSYKSSEIICIKDPRMCILFPAYEQALQQLGYEISIIRMIRDTEEVAKSLAAVYTAPENFNWKACIDTYNALIDLHLTSGFETYLTIYYPQLLEATHATMLQIHNYLPFLNFGKSEIRMIDSFLDISLKHH